MKKKINLRTLTENFLLNEGRPTPNAKSYLQSLSELLSSLSPRSMTDARRLEVAMEHIRNVQRHVRKLEEENSGLQERLKVLEEQEG